MDNVILFPKTVDFYEQELTRFLQTEQYEEALQLLAFLLHFPNLETGKHGQWEALQGWLQTMAPEAVFPSGEALEENLEGEEELLRLIVAEKTSGNAAYPDKLISMLKEGSMEQQLTAIEQLAFVEHEDISRMLRDWLSEVKLHPSIQFKVLQTLKQRGDKGYICMPKNGEEACVEIEETPLSPEEFPAIVRDMLRRVSEVSEVDHPDFSFFAEQTWNDFLSFAYGTSMYTELLSEKEGSIDIWASSLHAVLQEMLFGTINQAELMEKYGITAQMQLQWKQTYTILRKFIEAVFPA
jgi:hypothetical protein